MRARGGLILLLFVAAATAFATAPPLRAATPTAAPGITKTSTATSARERETDLSTSLERALSNGCLSGARVGLAVASLPDGNVVFERNAAAPLMPASTMKVLTTAAALEKAGPDFRFGTEFLTDGPLENGVVAGNLYVRGSGAPDIVVERWWDIATELYALGIDEIHGDVVGDDSYFQGEQRAPGWPGSGNSNPYNSPISALSANFNTVEVTVVPTKSGNPPLISVQPESDFIRIVNRARTGGSGRGSRISMKRAYDGRTNTITISGTISPRSGLRKQWIGIEDPPRAAAAALRDMLLKLGVVVSGAARVGTTPEDAVLVWRYDSRPLAEIVTDANKNSNNFITECLHRALGAQALGPPGTREKGVQAVGEFLSRSGVAVDGVRLVDGSGLSRDNRVTARALIEVLVQVQADPVAGAAFLESLPVAGQDGTLGHRLPEVRGRIHAKTGSISGARALAGYATGEDGLPVRAFAVLVNDYRCSDGSVTRAIDEIARRIATSPASPPEVAARLAPSRD